MSFDTLVLPLNFSERSCDRLLIGKLLADEAGEAPRARVLWTLVMIWRDFAIARDDRREVPLDGAARALSDAVLIIEQFAGWWGPRGELVQQAIDAGFFRLCPLDDSRGELVLTDFFPANHGNTRGISNSSLGGINKAIGLARKAAEAQAREQLNLFTASDNPIVNEFGKQGLERIMVFINQLCRVLERPVPKSEEWKATLVTKASKTLSTWLQEDLDRAFRWFKANRHSKEIPPRLDFILDQFGEFVAKARKDFK